MKSPFFKTYAALALLVALGGYIYFVERERDPEAGEVLFADLEPDAVREVRLAGGDETIRLVREGEQWRLAEPIQVEADDAVANGLVTAVGRLEIDEVLEGSGSRPADFGLEPPRRVVSLFGEGGAELARFELGTAVTGADLVYARAPGRPDVFTLASSIDTTTGKSAFELRDRNVLGVARDQVRGLEASGPEGDYALERDGDQWRFVRPLHTRAGRFSVDGLLGLITNLTMVEVAAEEAESLAEFGLDPPARRVVLTLEDGSSRTLEIGALTREIYYYAREASRRLVAEVPQAVVQDLSKGMEALRSKRLTEVSSFDVTGITATVGGEARVWARASQEGEDGFDTHTWARTAPDEAEAATADVEDALFKLGGLEVVEFLDDPAADADYGFDAPLAVIALRREDAPEVELRIGRAGDATYGRRPGDESVLRLDGAAVDELLQALEKISG